MLQISVYPCRMCVLLLYASWLSTSADLSKFLKSLSLSRLISPHCSLHEMGWKERQQKYLCRGKLRFHPEKSPNLKNSEENAIEKDCFPQPFVVIPSKSGVVKGLARLRVHYPHSLQLESRGYFCLLMPYRQDSR